MFVPRFIKKYYVKLRPFYYQKIKEALENTLTYKTFISNKVNKNFQTFRKNFFKINTFHFQKQKTSFLLKSSF